MGAHQFGPNCPKNGFVSGAKTNQISSWFSGLLWCWTKNREMVRFRQRREKQQSSSSPGSLSNWLDGPGAAWSVKSSSLVSTIKLGWSLNSSQIWCKLYLKRSNLVFFSILTGCLLSVVFVWYWYYLDIIWFLCNWVSTQLSPLHWLLLSRRWGLG